MSSVKIHNADNSQYAFQISPIVHPLLSGLPNVRFNEGDHDINKMDICHICDIDLTPKAYEEYAALDFRFLDALGALLPC